MQARRDACGKSKLKCQMTRKNQQECQKTSATGIQWGGGSQITNVEQACEMMFQSLSRSRLQGSLPNSISPQDTRRTSGFQIQRNETAIGAFSNARAVWPNPMDMLKHLANEVIQCAKARDLMVCTAEFCSAGKLAMVLSKTEGASKYFLGGMVAYTKEMKTRLLSVPSDLIQRDTAVSAEVAEAMAQGAIRRFNADLGVSITGVAGPEPDEDGNPVGCGLLCRSLL